MLKVMWCIDEDYYYFIFELIVNINQQKDVRMMKRKRKGSLCIPSTHP